MWHERNGVICVQKTVPPKKNNASMSVVVFCTTAFDNGLSLLQTIEASTGTGLDIGTIISAWEISGLPIYNDQQASR